MFDELAAGVLYSSIVIPYAVYAFAYKKPKVFLRYCSPKGFTKISEAFKVVSILLTIYFTIKAGVNHIGVGIGIPLVVVGQYLNSLVYKILGEERTYYGYEFGICPPKIYKEFPFTLSHPQYKGSLLTAIGSYICVNDSRVLTVATLLWCISYFFIISVESTNSDVVPQ